MLQKIAPKKKPYITLVQFFCFLSSLQLHSRSCVYPILLAVSRLEIERLLACSKRLHLQVVNFNSSIHLCKPKILPDWPKIGSQKETLYLSMILVSIKLSIKLAAPSQILCISTLACSLAAADREIASMQQEVAPVACTYIAQQLYSFSENTP